VHEWWLFHAADVSYGLPAIRQGERSVYARVGDNEANDEYIGLLTLSSILRDHSILRVGLRWIWMLHKMLKLEMEFVSKSSHELVTRHRSCGMGPWALIFAFSTVYSLLLFFHLDILRYFPDTELAIMA
jgi:hypothetical protein